MKLKLIGISVVAALSLSSFAQAATTTVNGGTVHFVGELVNAACSVATESQDQTVQLGQYRTEILKIAGDVSTKIPFNINLVNCDTKIAKTAKVSFHGPQDADNLQLLAVSATGGNQIQATKVGIEILDDTDKTLPPDNSSLSSAYTLIDNNNSLKFFARYKATGKSTAGQANADATFRMIYE